MPSPHEINSMQSTKPAPQNPGNINLSAAHWKMLRAMVAPGTDDMFLVGDTHQRIYDNHVTLSSLGINIRGRSSRLTLSYRTTRQILAAALEIMSGEVYDDLDGGAEDLAGYRSLLRGERPTFRAAATWSAERDLVARQLQARGNPTDGSVAALANTRGVRRIKLRFGVGVGVAEDASKCGGTVGHAKSRVCVLQMFGDRCRGDDQLTSDLGPVHADGQAAQHVQLASR